MFVLVMILFIIVCLISVFFYYLLKKLDEQILDLYEITGRNDIEIRYIRNKIVNNENIERNSVLK